MVVDRAWELRVIGDRRKEYVNYNNHFLRIAYHFFYDEI